MSKPAYRNDEDPRYYDPGYPDELDDALPCHCGGDACFHVARNHGDTTRLFCNNHRCGRIVLAVSRSIKEAVEEWNKEVAGEKSGVRCEFCDGLGSISYNPNLNPNVFPAWTTAKCPHCGGTGSAEP